MKHSSTSRPVFLALAIAWAALALAEERPDGPVQSLSELPPPVVEALKALCAPCTFADIGGAWQATGMITSNLPRRRVIQASKAGAEWTIEYEHSGRGRHTHTATFAVTPSVRFVRGSCALADPKKCDW